MKIVVFGLGQLNFLTYLYRSVKAYDHSLEVSVVGPQINSSTSVPDPSVFRRFLLVSASFLFLVPSFFISLLSARFWKIASLIFFVEGKPGKAIHFMYRWMIELSFFKKNKSFKEADCFHFHYMQYSYLRMIFFAPRNMKVICSFWGSDLLRTGDVLNHFVVGSALERADVITVQSVELREIVLAKFGRHLKSKIEVIKFSLEEKTFSAIDTVSENEIHLFKERYGIKPDQQVLLLGNNANPFNNHLSMIESLSHLPDKRGIFLLIPFNYGLEVSKLPMYKQALTQSLENAGFEFAFIETYLGPGELAVLRRATDIMIHLPESDALSGAATEAMYAGSVFITGAWLPYSPFKEAGLFYYTVPKTELLPAVLHHVLNSKLSTEQRQSNKTFVADHFFPSVTGYQWNQLFKSLTGGK